MTKGKAVPRKSQKERDDRDERGTPLWLYQALNNIFHFNLDVCASAENHKHENYFTKRENALTQAWRARNFMNPPYSNIAPWIEKAYEESGMGNITVALLKSDHSTRWFKRLSRVAAVWLCDRRIRYEGANNCADFPSCIAIFDEKKAPGIRGLINMEEIRRPGYFPPEFKF